MALRLRRLREISRFLPRFLFVSEIPSQQCRGIFHSSFSRPLYSTLVKANASNLERGCDVRRCSSVSEATNYSFPEADFLTFIESILHELEGPHHCWLNRTVGTEGSFIKDGIFLVIKDGFLEKSVIGGPDHVQMIERVKFLKQRYPKLQIFGFQSSSSLFSVAMQARIIEKVMKEHVTFPILLSEKDFSEMENGACYLLFKGFRSPLLYHMKEVDMGVIFKAIEELSASDNANIVVIQNLKRHGAGPDVLKDPYICSFKNLLLYFPGCISANEEGNRLFLSDTNHHRIIITDREGKILDFIGSSPGFEDGEFESAKIMRPAASFYHVDEDCLYFADSENHAIRRADMKTRMLKTVYPLCNSDKKVRSLWSWILDKLGMGKEADPMPIVFDLNSVAFPWHLMKAEEDNLLIVNRSFETLWILNTANGEIEKVIKGFPKIMEVAGQMIMKKVSLLNEMLGDWLQQIMDSRHSFKGLSYAGLISSFAFLQDDVVFCDTVGQRILKYRKASREVSSLQFSNFGILGLPYWLAYPPERVSVREDLYGIARNDCIHHCNVLPGRCDIQVNVEIPEGTELAAPLEEGCIWRQARGSAVEVSGVEAEVASSEKVGVAQQWYDELDNLAFSKPGLERNKQDEEIEENTSDISSQGKNALHIYSAVNISPGTSEVVINAVFYLKLTDQNGSCSNHLDTRTAEMVLDISDHDKSQRQGADGCVHALLESHRNPRDLIFMKFLQLRIRFECADHPKSKNSTKEIVSTNSTLALSVTLD